MPVERLKEARKSHKQVIHSIEAKMFDKSPLRKIPFVLKNDFGDTCDRYYGFQTETGKSADPRTMRLLEFFRHLYYRRGETFERIVPSGLREEFEELFDRIGALFSAMKSKHKVKTVQRSLSAGSGLKLERFKVKIVRPDIDNGGDKSSNTSGDNNKVKG